MATTASPITRQAQRRYDWSTALPPQDWDWNYYNYDPARYADRDYMSWDNLRTQAGAYIPYPSWDDYNQYYPDPYADLGEPPIDWPEEPAPPPPTETAPPPTTQPDAPYMFSVGLPDTPFSTESPEAMAEQNRLAARGWGQAMDQSLLNYIQQQEQLEGNVLPMLFGEEGYGPILRGDVGYSPEEEAGIMQQGLIFGEYDANGNWVPGALASPDELFDLQLRDIERQQIYGSPWDTRDIFTGAPDAQGNWQPGMSDWLLQIENEGGKRQREGYTALGDELRDVIDPELLALDPRYAQTGYNVVDSLRSGYGDILSPDYLTLSPEFTNAYQVSDRDLQNIRDQAGFGVGARTQAEQDALERAAAAAGNSSPEAIAAAKSRMQLTGEQAKSRAMLDAEIAAKALALDTARNREGMRLGAEQTFAGMSADALQRLTNTRLAQMQEAEQARLEANRDIVGRRSAAASEVGQARLASERDISGRMTEAGRYNVGTTLDLTKAAEAEASRRAAELATNRQNSQANMLATRYGQYMPASEALSQRSGAIAGQRKSERAEGRNFLSNFYGGTQQTGSTARGQRIAAGGTMMQGIEQPVGDVLNYQSMRTPAWARILSAGAQVAGSIFGG